MSNLTSFQVSQNQPRKAALYKNKIKKYRASNPYYVYAIARQALADRNHQQAIRELKKAIRLNRSEAAFYYLLHIAYERAGNSRKSLKKKKNLGILPGPASSIS
jgi:Flp pilus assembly protein TadD